MSTERPFTDLETWLWQSNGSRLYRLCLKTPARCVILADGVDAQTRIQSLERMLAANTTTRFARDLTHRDSLTGLIPGDRVFVLDASADPAIGQGSAMYVYIPGSGWLKTWGGKAEFDFSDAIAAGGGLQLDASGRLNVDWLQLPGAIVDARLAAILGPGLEMSAGLLQVRISDRLDLDDSTTCASANAARICWEKAGAAESLADAALDEAAAANAGLADQATLCAGLDTRLADVESVAANALQTAATASGLASAAESAAGAARDLALAAGAGAADNAAAIAALDADMAERLAQSEAETSRILLEAVAEVAESSQAAADTASQALTAAQACQATCAATLPALQTAVDAAQAVADAAQSAASQNTGAIADNAAAIAANSAAIAANASAIAALGGGQYVTTGAEEQQISGRKTFQNIQIGFNSSEMNGSYVWNDWSLPFVYGYGTNDSLAGIYLTETISPSNYRDLIISVASPASSAEAASIILSAGNNSGVPYTDLSLSHNPPLISNSKSIATTKFTNDRIRQIAQDRINQNLDLWVDAEAGEDDPDNEDPARGLSADTAFKTINAAIRRATMVWRLYSSAGHMVQIILKNLKSDGTAQLYDEDVCLRDGISDNSSGYSYMLTACDCATNATLPKVRAISVGDSRKWAVKGLHLIGSINSSQIYSGHGNHLGVIGPMVFDTTNISNAYNISAVVANCSSYLEVRGKISLNGIFKTFVYAYYNSYALLTASMNLNLEQATTVNNALFSADSGSGLQFNNAAGFASPANWQGGSSYYISANSFINTAGKPADFIPGTAGYKDASSAYL